MSYSMGMMYATAGLGVAVKPLPTTTTTGTTIPKEQRSVRVLQQLLQARGFNPGSIDGAWGLRTQSALFSAIGEVTFTVSTDKRQVWLFVADWARLQRLPIRGSGSGPGPGPGTEPGGEPSIVTDTDYLPWVLGAGALLAVGGWYMMRGKKMRRNQRRRRRSSRR